MSTALAIVGGVLAWVGIVVIAAEFWKRDRTTGILAFFFWPHGVFLALREPRRFWLGLVAFFVGMVLAYSGLALESQGR
ncbi:MAG: hypothetical protein HYS12_14265 [Planctomycetes bacterium]|nr:hypothetical protein [Planctomycetota bacterium]